MESSPAGRHSLTRLQVALRLHRDFILILGLAVAFRAMALLVFRPGGYLGEMSDFGYYRLLLSFSSQGFYPLIDFWVEYPPIIPWLLVGLYRLSLLIPAWLQPGTGFYLLLGSFLTLVEAGNLILLYGIARRLHGQDCALRLCWIYALLLIPVLTLFGWFDGLALLFLLWAVLLTLDRKPVGSGVAIALGFMTKLVPIAALPAAFQHLRRASERLRLLLATLATLLLVAAPFLFTRPQYLIQSLKSPVIRSTWETIWALIDGYYSFGVAGGVDRFDPAMAGAAQHPTRLPWLVITTGFILFCLFLFTRRVDWSDCRRVVAFTALTQNLLTLYFKGYSPQFLIMLLPFILLLIPGWRGIAYILLLSAINLVEYPIYFLVLPDEHWLLTGTVILRTLVLIVVSVEYGAQVYGRRVSERVWQRLAAVITGLVLLVGATGAIFGFQAYAQVRYDASPHRAAMELLQQQATPGALLVTDDQAVHEELYPFLHSRLTVRLLETHDWLPSWEPRLAAAAAEPPGQLWVYARAGSPLHGWLAGRYPAVTDRSFGDWRLTGWDTQ